MIRSIVTFLLSLLLFSNTVAQISFIVGANYCGIRNNNLLENQKPIFTYQFGYAIQYYPFKSLPNLSIQNELLFSQKGYQQDLDKNYVFHFNYISLPVLLNYTPVSFLTINTGVEFSGLLYTNIQEGTKTYNNNDVGLVLGISCIEKHMISLYSRVTYGLIPMLNYYSIDKLGNFTGRIHDLRNICFTIGIKFNFYNEEIHLYK